MSRAKQCASLFEAASGEQHFLRELTQVKTIIQLRMVCQYVLTVFAMNHAKQIVIPMWRAGLPLIAQRDAVLPGQLLA